MLKGVWVLKLNLRISFVVPLASVCLDEGMGGNAATAAAK
jgi:hypothetical protein